MNTAATSRRAVLRGLVATPLFATPVLAFALSTSPDPIFAAIAAWHQAWADVNAAGEELGALEESITDGSARTYARVEYGTTRDPNGAVCPRYFCTHADIDKLVPFPRKQAELRAALDADQKFLDEAGERSGLISLREREERAWKTEGEMLRATCYVVPTTLAGLLAYVEWAREWIWDPEVGPMSGERGAAANAASYETLETALAMLTQA